MFFLASKRKNSFAFYFEIIRAISLKFQTEIETKFFNHFLKGKGDKNSGLPEAYVFDSGKKEWKSYDSWPPKNVVKQDWFLSNNQELTADKKLTKGIEFISDIKRPVPIQKILRQFLHLVNI